MSRLDQLKTPLAKKAKRGGWNVRVTGEHGG